MTLQSVFAFCCIVSIQFVSYSQLNEAIEEYKGENWLAAKEKFQFLLDSSYSTEADFYLGMVNTQLENYALGQFHFERILKFMPNDINIIQNAELAHSFVNSNDQWSHPYPMITRLILKIPLLGWIILAITFSLLLSITLYFIIGRKKSNYKLHVLLLASSLIISVGCLIHSESHYSKNQYVFTFDNIQTYASIEGVETDIKLEKGRRYKLLEQNNDWSRIAFNNNFYWIPALNIGIY